MSEIPGDAVGLGTAEAVDADRADDAVDDAARSAAPGPSPAEPSSAEVGRALAEIGSLDALDLADHPDAYQRIHAELQNALASIDDA